MLCEFGGCNSQAKTKEKKKGGEKHAQKAFCFPSNAWIDTQ
jgi:hypothetical protein